MDRLQQLMGLFLNLSLALRLAVIAVATAALASIVFGIANVNAPDYLPLYRNLSPSDSARIEATLISAGFNVQVSDDGTVVNIDRLSMARARMTLAETGVPIKGDPGWELFDNQSGLAMNSFLQKVNRLRALEGELARSIQTLNGVVSARVHLVLPEREAFSREQSEPRASVVVRAEGARSISRKQAIAIRNLVASSVAKLELNRVTVLSAAGELILAEEGSTGSETMQTSRTAIEDRLAREVENILTARVGAGNARVRVNVELNSTRETIFVESFDPDQKVVRSSETKLNERTTTESAGNVGVENNIPSALVQPEGNGSGAEQTDSGELVQYEIGSTKHEIIKEAGEIKRISVAVLVNGVFTLDGAEVSYSERDPAEIERLGELVKTAVGFTDDRGDTVSIDSFRFMDYSMELGEPVSFSIGQQISRNVGSIVRGLISLAFIAIVLLLGLRPTLRLIREQQAVLPNAPNENLLPRSDGAAETNTPPITSPALMAVGGVEKPGLQQVIEPSSKDELINAAGISGRLQKSRIESFQQLASDRPDQVVRVLRSWMVSEPV